MQSMALRAERHICGVMTLCPCSSVAFACFLNTALTRVRHAKRSLLSSNCPPPPDSPCFALSQTGHTYTDRSIDATVTLSWPAPTEIAWNQ